MEFDWSPEDLQHRTDVRAFLDDVLPEDWEQLSEGGPGSDVQAEFSRRFCRELAERGWLTQHWPAEYGGRDAPPWRHSIIGEECWANGEPRWGEETLIRKYTERTPRRRYSSLAALRASRPPCEWPMMLTIDAPLLAM